MEQSVIDFGYDMEKKVNKISSDLYIQIRHLKTFKELSGNENGGIWCIRWLDGQEIEVFNDKSKMKFNVPDIHLAEYIVSMHNYLNSLIKEVESKYD
jgi:hypothetical protein